MENLTLCYKSKNTGDNSVELYYSDICKYPVLSHEEQIELFKKYNEGCMESKEKLIACNLRLVPKFLPSFNTSSTSDMDLIQAGNIGLMHAVETFDYKRGLAFSTHAAFKIVSNMQIAIFYESRVIRLPRHINTDMRKIYNFTQKFEQENSRPPSETEISKGTGLLLKKVKLLMELQNSVTSLNNQIADELEFGDLIEDSSFNDPFESTIEKISFEESMNIIEEFIEGLKPDSKFIMENRVLNRLKGVEKILSAKEIGEILGCTAQNVNLKEQRLKAKMLTLLKRNKCL